MTRQEGSSAIRLNRLRDACTTLTGETTQEVNSIRNMLRHCRTAVRALREPDNTMYRWHDLKIDSDDLPPEEGLYAITVEYDVDSTELGFGKYENVYGYSGGWVATVPSYGKVIAWKKIRPYEAR